MQKRGRLLVVAPPMPGVSRMEFHTMMLRKLVSSLPMSPMLNLRRRTS